MIEFGSTLRRAREAKGMTSTQLAQKTHLMVQQIEALEKQKAEGTERKLVGIEVFDRAIPRAGYPVELDDETEVGVVTTGYHSISLDKSICFALVKKEYSALGTKLNVRIRKKVFPGEVIKKRFYQTNYKK